MEKAYSWLKAATAAFTFKTLLIRKRELLHDYTASDIAIREGLFEALVSSSSCVLPDRIWAPSAEDRSPHFPFSWKSSCQLFLIVTARWLWLNITPASLLWCGGLHFTLLRLQLTSFQPGNKRWECAWSWMLSITGNQWSRVSLLLVLLSAVGVLWCNFLIQSWSWHLAPARRSASSSWELELFRAANDQSFFTITEKALIANNY